jgi:EAL domain-containing protein (putative c-di-GMP-specific phosphodiesterase class I)
VLQQAVAQAEQWRQQGIKTLAVSVNLSAVQLSQSDIVRQIEQVGLPPELLELELTESAVMNNVEKTIDTLNQIHALGVQLSIDDFGTGYSSLSYLKRFPLDTLKIDRSFVSDITTEPCDATICKTICKTIVAMAHNLNLKGIAKDLETKQELAS